LAHVSHSTDHIWTFSTQEKENLRKLLSSGQVQSILRRR